MINPIISTRTRMHAARSVGDDVRRVRDRRRNPTAGCLYRECY
eukprot:COSAG01_NODE_30801_length_609_cov_1.133333_1_plen_42_part_10